MLIIIQANAEHVVLFAHNVSIAQLACRVITLQLYLQDWKIITVLNVIAIAVTFFLCFLSAVFLLKLFACSLNIMRKNRPVNIQKMSGRRWVFLLQ